MSADGNIAWNTTGDSPVVRTYDIEGESYPSVTSVLNCLNDFLFVHIRWIEEGVGHLVESIRENRKVETWDECGPGEYEKVESDPRDLILDPRFVSRFGFRKMKQKADAGTVRHRYLEDYSVGIFPTDKSDIIDWTTATITGYGFDLDPMALAEEIVPISRHLAKWRPEILASESVCYDKTHRYAGTFDAIARYENHPKFKQGVIDLKPQVERKHVAQLAAYNFAEFLYVDGMSRPKPAFDQCGILVVKEGKCGLRTIDIQEMELYFDKVFKPALELMRVAELPMPKEQALWDK